MEELNLKLIKPEEAAKITGIEEKIILMFMSAGLINYWKCKIERKKDLTEYDFFVCTKEIERIKQRKINYWKNFNAGS